MENQEQKKQLTFGQQLVGLSFNPSGDPKVTRAKELCAELADLIEDHMNENREGTGRQKQMLATHTMGEILNAQMNAVKVLTFK